jgi:hypothetical protein
MFDSDSRCGATVLDIWNIVDLSLCVQRAQYSNNIRTVATAHCFYKNYAAVEYYNIKKRTVLVLFFLFYYSIILIFDHLCKVPQCSQVFTSMTLLIARPYC